MVELRVKPLRRLKPRRRWAQFSLRTVLLIVTASCAALSLWVVPAERQRRAVVAVRALDGEVSYASRGGTVANAFPLRILRRWLPPDYFDDVIEVQLSGSKVTDDGLVHLRDIGNLQRLNLYGTNITGAGFAHSHGLTNLRWLNLNRTRFTDVGLSHLDGLTGLEELYLDGTQVTDAGLAQLEKLAGLRSIWLNDTLVTDDGLASLHGLADLEWLFLGGTQVTDAGVSRLRRALPNCQIVTRVASTP